MFRRLLQSKAAATSDLPDGVASPADFAPASVGDDDTGGIANFRTIALIIACARFMENLDATVLATALPTMARDFGVPVPETSVALTAYLLALAMFIPASGAISDRLGAKPVFRAAIGLFMLGSLACGLAPTLELMTVARLVQGAGGALMIPVGRLILFRSVAKRDMVSAMSWLVMPALIGTIVGPPVGGFIATYLDWRWIFWLNLPIGLLGIILSGRFIPDIRDDVSVPFDFWGFLLSAVALGALLAGFESFNHPNGLGYAVLLILIGMVVGTIYIRRSRRVTSPILDMSLLRVPTFRLSFLAGSVTRITHGAQPFLLPLMMQLAFGLSPVQSGSVSLATTFGSFAMKGVATRILRAFGFRLSLIVMGVLGSAAYAAFGLLRPGWPLPAMFIALAISGFLMSFQFTAYNTIAYDEIPRDRISSATSFYATFQQLTLSMGICIGATVLQLSMFAHSRAEPNISDFSFAFWTISAISILAVFFNARFSPSAGAEMSGRKG